MYLVGPSRVEGYHSHGVPVLVHQPGAVRNLLPQDIAEQAPSRAIHMFLRRGKLPADNGRHVGESIYLAMRMMEGNTHHFSLVLENEHVLN